MFLLYTWSPVKGAFCTVWLVFTVCIYMRYVSLGAFQAAWTKASAAQTFPAADPVRWTLVKISLHAGCDQGSLKRPRLFNKKAADFQQRSGDSVQLQYVSTF